MSDEATFTPISSEQFRQYIDEANRLSQLALAQGVTLFGAALAGAGFIRLMCEERPEYLDWWVKLITMSPDDFWKEFGMGIPGKGRPQ